jgi:diketogulonate reductase-like aldo/keto reductase
MKKAVKHAINAGYRHIDTAKLYGNEDAIGQAIKECGVPRDQIFITTKLWNDQHDHVEKAFEESLKDLDCGYVDMYLIHTP